MKRTLTEQQKKTLSVLAIVIFVLLSAALAWFVGRPMVRFARQPEQFRAWVEPLEIAGGYAFGAWAGTALCLLGAVLGSVTVFALVRRWGRGLVEVFFPADKLEKQNMKLCLNCEMDTLPMDFDLMRSALVNLVENARKASRDGQTIYLCAKNNTIEVRDFGQGIPPKELPRITEPFYMVDKSRSRKAGGVGLGLALVKRIVAMHGGKLSILSQIELGTCVEIELPI